MSDPLPVHPAALPKRHSIAEYEVVRVLGAGGFGITYLAFDHQLDGPVAIKEYFPAELATRIDGDQVAATATTNRETFAWGLERFLEEARAVHRFRHPNVVRAHRYLEANATAYLVMEYVEGESLKSILDRRGNLSADEWRPWMDALLDGLEHVHSHGYLHRDIKPANIVIRSEDGEPVLIDFGSARLQHRDRTHTQVLSAVYAPIEQHSTGATQGPPTDIYALAATSYRALAGIPISSAPDRILNDDYKPLADSVGATELQWLAAIDHGLAVRPENRPQTVEEWRTELVTADGAAPPKSNTAPPETAEPITIRTGFIGEYEIVRVLGAGGFGITYLAFDHLLDAPVAIKEYFPAELATRVDRDQVAATAPTNQETFAWGLERFLDEARTVHRFRHRNVVQVHGHFEANGTAYLIMDYVEGESLKAILDRRGSLSAEEWRPWMDALLGGLEHVHSHGYLHRDIKPANIVVRSEDGEPVLIDFGSARLQHRDRTHTQVLSAAYAPIEQHSIGATQGPPADIYALAATSYRVLTGTPISSAPDRILNDDYVPLVDRLEGAEHQWLAAIDQGLVVRPENRPQTAEDWRTELAGTVEPGLEAVQRTGTISGVPQDLSTSLPEIAESTSGTGAAPTRDSVDAPSRPPRRWPAVAVVGALLLFGAAMALVLSSMDAGDSEAHFVRGEKHYYGDGTAQDYSAAIEWYRKAADQGHATAQFNLGLMYFDGEGVTQDREGATEWFLKAADQGHAEAQYSLGLMYALGEGAPQDREEAARWSLKAAEQGHATAQFNLGLMYFRGEGVTQDYVRAYAWWEIAAAQGHEQARENRDRIGDQMTIEQLFEAVELSLDDLVSQ